MSGFGRHMEVEWKCPFCRKGLIKVYYREGFTQAKASSISAGKKYTKSKVDDSIENVGNDCPECGKSSEEIKKAYEKGEEREITPEEHKKRLERFKDMGLPTKIVRKRN